MNAVRTDQEVGVKRDVLAVDAAKQRGRHLPCALLETFEPMTDKNLVRRQRLDHLIENDRLQLAAMD